MSDKKRLIKSVVIGTLSGITLTIILMCVLSAVMLTSGLLPTNVLNIAVIAMLGVGCLAAGFIAVKISKRAGLVVGLASGLVIFLTVTAVSLFGGEPVTVLTLIKLTVCLVAGGLGGILGLREKHKI